MKRIIVGEDKDIQVVKRYDKDRLISAKSYRGKDLHGSSYYYSDEGIISLIEEYRDGELHGRRISYNEVGIVDKVEVYKEGQALKDTWQYDGLGILKEIVSYQEEGEAIVKQYDSEGRLELVERSVDGILEGELYTYNKGILQVKNPYKNGRLEGIVDSYDNLGRLMGESNFIAGEMLGEYRVYSEGKLLAQGDMGSGLDYSVVTTYDEGSQGEEVDLNEELKNNYNDYALEQVDLNRIVNECKISYINLPKIEKELGYSDNLEYPIEEVLEEGRVKRIKKLSNREKLYQIYDAEENLIIQANYIENKLNGAITYYHLNGEVFAKLNYTDTYELDSLCRWYFESGQLSSQVNYQGNQQNGEAIWYYEDGKKAVVANYLNGLLDGVIETYDINGRIIMREEKREDSLNGIVMKYYGNGNIASYENYQSDKLHGEAQYYNEDGSLEKSINYKEGLVVEEV